MSVREPWIDRVERRLARWCEQGLGKAWVVAVSGGGDSVGLLRVLHQLAGPLGLRLSVAHLDHGVRGEAARADAAFVAALAGSLDLPFVLGAWQPTRSGHFESDARRARYDWLTEAARARGASVIAVGHTRDDQAETILHRIVRGTGPRGLAGMPRTRLLASKPRITLARPLLGVSRREVRDYLAELKQPFREDASNADLSRTRARIRHDLLPKLAAEYNPNVALALVRLGSLASSFERAVDADLRSWSGRRLSPMHRIASCSSTASCGRFPSFSGRKCCAGCGGTPAGPKRACRRGGGGGWRPWFKTTRSPGSRSVPAWRFRPSSCFLVLRRLPAPASSSVGNRSSGTNPPRRARADGRTLGGWRDRCTDRSRPEDSRAETIDLERVSLPLVVRTAAAGDRFDPLGMDGQSMPLADFFRGRHVRREHRTRVPLVCDQNGIIWVVGHRIADRVKVNEEDGSHAAIAVGGSQTLPTCNRAWEYGGAPAI